MGEMRDGIPVVALKGLTVLPDMTISFDAARPFSIAAVEAAMAGYEEVFLVTQKDPEKDDPGFEDLYHVGTVSHVRQFVRMPNGYIRVTVEGKAKARLLRLDRGGEYLAGVVEEMGDWEDNLSVLEHEAMIRVIRDKLHEFSDLNPGPGRDFYRPLFQEQSLEKLLRVMTIQFPWDFEDRQKMLECESLSEAYEVLLKLLMMETEVFQIKKQFQSKVKEAIDKNQRDYVLREQMQVIKEELGDSADSEADEMRRRLEALDAPAEVKEKLEKDIRRFEEMPPGSQDGNVLHTYIDTVLELPWNKTTKDNMDLGHAKEILEADHYGLEKVKDRVLESLAVRILTKKASGSIICLVGPPGTGKTSIARSIARALDKQYVRISLGGVRDEAEIRGHRKTYVGAMPGRIVDGLRQAGVSNPLMLLDEIDKVSSDYKGDTGSALLEVLDSEQNVKFRDHYVEIPVDLSRVLFIATANTTATIPLPLIDRMDIIEVSSYTENEKFHIGHEYLIPKQMEKNGLTPEMLTITQPALRKIIHNYTAEAGVRNLERRIGDICRKSAREILENRRKSVRVTPANLEKFLGRERVPEEDQEREDQVGVVTGLAWTSVGGVTLKVEVNIYPGKGGLVLTGKMGDVMKESAQIALTWVRSVATKNYGIPAEFFAENDLHIHIPEGAVPKDGPSAGITLSTALLSAVTGRKVLSSVAMTGEVTLRGHVLMIGGLKEKLLAAKQAGIKTVLVPWKNQPDVAELSKEITGGMEIVYVREMEEVIERAFVPEKKPAARRKTTRKKAAEEKK